MEIEQKIKEIRTGEAIKKNLTKKLTVIARFLGQEIIQTGGRSTDGFSFEEHSLEEWNDDEDISTADVGGCPIGWMFDGLSFGCNMQIICYADSHHIKTTCDGVIVYEEIQGELQRYLPDNVWESRIDHWVKRAEQNRKQDEQDKSTKIAEEKQSFLIKVRKKIRETWGF